MPRAGEAVTARACVYFIQQGSDGPIKIGVSRLDCVLGRLSSLQSANAATLRITRLIAGGVETEGVLHERYAKARIRGEWFHPTEHLAQLACAQPGANGERAAPDTEEIKRAYERGRKDGYVLGETATAAAIGEQLEKLLRPWRS